MPPADSTNLMPRTDKWPLWEWVLFTNAMGAIGICLGFFSGTKLAADRQAYIAVPAIVFLNLMLLAVRPRIAGARAAGKPPSAMGVLYKLLSERPILTLVCVLQLVGATRSTAATVQILQTSTRATLQSLPNSQSMVVRLIAASILMGLVTLLWWLGAVGLWVGRRWAWWLALTLNAQAAMTTGIIQLFKLNGLFDPWATTAVLLLLLRPIRQHFDVGRSRAKHIEVA